MNDKMSNTEALCLAFLLACGFFFLDVWLSGIYLEHSQGVKQYPPAPEHGFQHTREEKAILCTASKDCMEIAKAVIYEARGEPLEGRRLVAQVIMNRVNHKNWPDTVKEVVHQPKQFSFVNDWMRQKTPTQKDWTEAQAIAYNVLNGLVEDKSQGATHYTEVSVQRRWMKNLEYVTTINNHKFYRGDN